MKEQLNKILSSISEFWQHRTKRHKIAIIGGAAGLLLFAIILTIVLNIKNETVLYTGLEAAEATEIMQQIQDIGVEATQTGDKIVVPNDQVDKLKLQLAAKGYPKSALSYDISSKVDMFTTDKQAREIYKQQLQERMITTLETIEGVEQAIVTLDIPQVKDYVINDKQDEATASVVLHLKPGVSLAPEQVAGIKYIIAKGVSTLKVDNVVITDGTGAVLNSDVQTSQKAEDEKFKFKKEFEGTIKDEIKNLLLPVYGDGNIVVAVSATLNYDKKVSEDTQFSPSVDNSGMVDSEETSSASGNEGNNGGVVGASPNADGTDTTSGAATDYPTSEDTGNQYYDEKSSKIHYLVNTKKTQIEKQGYSIDQLTVSVMVNQAQMTDGTRTDLVKTIARAAGTKEELVQITNSAFLDTNIPNLPGEAAAQTFTLQQILLYGGILLGVFVLLLIVVLLLSRNGRRKKHKSKASKTGEVPTALETGELAAVGGAVYQPQDFNIASLTEAANQDTRETVLKREIGEFAKSSPEIAAQLIRTWLREEGE